MKRLISLFLCLLITLSTVTVAFASSASSNDTAIEASGQLQRVSEIVELREPNSDTYLLSDGTYECVIYAEDKYYYDEARTLRLIDNTVKANGTLINTYGEYKNAANSFDIFFSNSVTPEVTILNQKSKLIFNPITSANNKSGLISETTSSIDIGKIDNCKPLDILTQTGDNTVRYENVFPETDLIYVVSNHALKEYIVLNNSNAPNEFDFEFSIEGLKVDNEAGTPRFVDATGDTMFALGQLFAIDANEVVSDDLQYEIVPSKSSDKITIRVIVSKDYLDDPLREFPVVIDPTVLISSSQTADAYVSSTNSTTNYYSNAYLRTGRDDPYGIRRTYIKFSIPSSVPKYSVTSAKLSLEKYSGVVPTMRAYQCSGSWSSSTITWANKPTFSYSNPSPIATVRSSGSSWYDMDVTKIVQGWVNGAYANYGFVVKDLTETNVDHWTTFYSSDAQSPHKPELRIIYNVPTIDVDLIYDYGYLDRYSTANDRVTAQANALKSKYFSTFGINVNYYAPNEFASYTDSVCTTSHSTKCSHATDAACTNSVLFTNGTTTLYNYHHNNINNIMLRIPFPNTAAYVRVAYIGHDNCAKVNGLHKPNYYYGLTYESIGLVTVMNFDTAASETKTLVHEFGHLYMAPDHYGGSVPTTEEIIEQTGNTGFSKNCIYGENKNTTSVINNLTICDGCAAVILANRNKYSH